MLPAEGVRPVSLPAGRDRSGLPVEGRCPSLPDGRCRSADAASPRSGKDIGGDIIPALVASGEAHVYDFSRNVVPGETPRDQHYWRDVGTLDSYYEANMDLVDPHPMPDFDQSLAARLGFVSRRANKTGMNRTDGSAADDFEFRVDPRSFGELVEDEAQDAGFIGTSCTTAR